MKYVLFVVTHNAGRSQMAQVPIPSHTLTLANKQARQCLCDEHCALL